MKVWLSPYRLESEIVGPRCGYLLKTQAENGLPGYADVFPWIEFGDPSFEDIPELIKKKQMTPLLTQSFNFSRRDAMERAAGKSLVAGIELNNHFHVSGDPQFWRQQISQAFHDGFTSVKIKVGRDPKVEIPNLLLLLELDSSRPWLRLDFNGLGDVEYFDQIAKLKPIVEFIEDPFSDSSLWEKKGWPWAYDQPQFEAAQVASQLRILKPAKQDWKKIDKRPLVFTSYLDHPVGIAHAVVEAASCGEQTLDYGLMTHQLYSPTEFHGYLSVNGPKLSVEGELGIGFDGLFAKQKWIELC